MSGLLAGKVWQSALAAELKPLAAALADIASDDGTRIYPSVEYIGWLLGRTRRAVQTGLSKLRKAEILHVVWGGKGGRHSPTEYRLIESKLPSRDPWRNSASIAPFPVNGAVCDTKERSLRHKRAQPTAHKPLRTVINKTAIENRLREQKNCPECCGGGYVYVEKGGRVLKPCPRCSPGVGEKRREA